MRIQTNVSALAAHRNMAGNQANAARNIERLSSGFRINSAKDDAAGMAISNKLRADVGALKQASRNASQGLAMLQTADGSAQTIGDILSRMKELATQANSSNIGSERDKLDLEFQQLKGEITRIADTTEYQGTSLISGGFGSKIDLTDVANTWDAAATGVANVSLNGTAVGTYTIGNAADGVITLSDGSVTETVSGVASATRQTVSFSTFGISLELTSAAVTATATSTLAGAVVKVEADTTAAFQVSSSGAYGGQDLVSVNAVDLTATGLSVNALDVLSAGNAQTALAAIDTAIGTVNTKLGEIGAAMNRIDYAQQNTETLIQNTEAANSTIRDADMAYEMMEFTKNNILSQAAQAMLAQANQQPQGVLQLLR